VSRRFSIIRQTEKIGKKKQKKLRESFMNWTKITRRLALATLIALPVAAHGPALAKTPADILVIAGRIDDMTSIDPAESFEFAGGDLARNVYDRLVMFNPNDLGEGYVPGLA